MPESDPPIKTVLEGSLREDRDATLLRKVNRNVDAVVALANVYGIGIRITATAWRADGTRVFQTTTRGTHDVPPPNPVGG